MPRPPQGSPISPGIPNIPLNLSKDPQPPQGSPTSPGIPDLPAGTRSPTRTRVSPGRVPHPSLCAPVPTDLDADPKPPHPGENEARPVPDGWHRPCTSSSPPTSCPGGFNLKNPVVSLCAPGPRRPGASTSRYELLGLPRDIYDPIITTARSHRSVNNLLPSLPSPCATRDAVLPDVHPTTQHPKIRSRAGTHTGTPHPQPPAHGAE